MPISERLVALLREVSSEITEVQKPVRVIPALTWPDEVEHEFFAQNASSLPKPTYHVSAGVAEAGAAFQNLARRLDGDNGIERFLRETCVSLSTAARMLQSIGSRDFYHHSVELYGRPASLSSDRRTTNLDLASHFEQVIAGFSPPLSAQQSFIHFKSTAAEALEDFKKRDEIRGEITLLLGRAEEQHGLPAVTQKNARTRVRELMKSESLDEKEAMKRVAKEMKISKSDVYRELQKDGKK